MGFLFDLLEAIKGPAGFTYDLKIRPDLDHGKKLRNDTWSGLIGALINNVIHVIF